jgi:L-fucose mutarotase
VLKGIPKLISPELLKVLAEMGHGDEIVLADANFPAASHARLLIRCDGHPATEVLDAILTLFPLDTFVDKPAALMQKVPGHQVETPVWDRFREIIAARAGIEDPFEMVERFAFYERAKKAYAIVSTGETALYGNIILKKGVL